MADSDQLERSRLALAELLSLWDSRSDSYGPFLYGVAFVREAGKWKNVITYIFPLHRTEQRDADLDADYGDFRVARGLITADEAKTALKDLVERGQLCLPKLPAVELTAYLYPESKRFCPSADRRFPIFHPFFEFPFSVVQNFKAHARQQTVFAIDLPVYPSEGDAIQDLLDVRLGGPMAYDGQLHALVPDYRARVRELRLSTKGLEVSVDTPLGSNEADLMVKLRYEALDGSLSQGTLSLKEGKATFQASDFARHLVLVLLSKSQKDLVDERRFLGGAPLYCPSISIETSEQDIEHLILGGESETVEFKKELPSKRERLAIAAASLANHRGGRILVGVDNDAQVVGCDLGSPKETIANIFRTHIDPHIDFAVEEIALRQKRVIVITIPPGKDKPYNVRDHGVYIRSGATDRIATRYELDQMYERKS